MCQWCQTGEEIILEEELWINYSADLGCGASGVETGIDSQKIRIAEFTTLSENSESAESGGLAVKSRPVWLYGFQIPVRAGVSCCDGSEQERQRRVFTVRRFLPDSDVLPRLMSLWSETDES